MPGELPTMEALTTVALHPAASHQQQMHQEVGILMPKGAGLLRTDKMLTAPGVTHYHPAAVPPSVLAVISGTSKHQQVVDNMFL